MRAPSHKYKGKLLKEFIDRFSQARVLVIGDIILDEYVWGDVSRISPEAPVPVVEIKQETQMLGGAANVVHNMAKLGAKPILCGVIGEDVSGKIILNNIQKLDLRIDGILSERERPTSVKTRVVARNQQVVRFDRESRRDIRTESIKKILGFIEKNLSQLDTIVVSDYGKGVVSGPLMKQLRELIDTMKERSVLLAVDPKTGNFQYYHGVDVLTPNHYEAGAFCGIEILDDETLKRAGKKILNDLACRSVLITQGRQGMTLFEEDGGITHIPTVAKKVFDVTGAGDTVIGTFALGLASGLDLKSAAILSNCAAGIVVGEVGTSTVSTQDLKTALES